MFRFFFFSREEPRPHIHVSGSNGEAKFWLEPAPGLARNYRLSETQIAELLAVVKERRDEFLDTWRRHFAG
ncbi:MAG: DUF4160 domain-containing protein [Acidobacteria bacterium]|nr:DUF4160 domain-containing protein [Acidobacteriota bacterium]